MIYLIRTKKIILYIFLLYSVLLTLIPLTNALDLYADLEITVDNAGFVSINGNTNYPDIIVEDSQIYTSKTQNIWILNIMTNVTFSDIVYSVRLPDYSKIISVNSSASTIIWEESGNLIIQGYASNKTLSIVVQYQTEKILQTEDLFKLDYLSIYLIFTIILLIICFLLILFVFNKRETSIFSSNKDKKFQSEIKGLNDRQKKILALLQKSKIALTQTEIQKELNMPKASVSRNIRRLELKGIIEKEQIGMSNLIRLKKP